MPVVQLVTVKLEEQGNRAVSTSDSEERPKEVPSPSESSDEHERRTPTVGKQRAFAALKLLPLTSPRELPSDSPNRF